MDGDVRSGECMPEAYSKELRNRIVQTYEVGEGGYAAIGIRFSVSAPTVFRWVSQVGPVVAFPAVFASWSFFTCFSAASRARGVSGAATAPFVATTQWPNRVA